MKTHFENKEHYLAFRKAWASAVNDKRAKQTLVKYEHTPYGWKSGSTVISCDRRKGWVTGAHHLLFNILREVPYETGFTPITRQSRLDNGHEWEAGLFVAWTELQRMQRYVELATNESTRTPDFYGERVLKFLEPFGDTVTMEMLSKIDLGSKIEHPGNLKKFIKQAA